MPSPIHRTVPIPAASTTLPRATALSALVMSADALFWHDTGSVALACQAVAIVLAVRATLPARPTPAAEGEAALILCLSLLPVLERVQFVSVLFLILGTFAAALRLGVRADAFDLLRLAARHAGAVPLRVAQDLSDGAHHRGPIGLSAGLILPAVFGALFIVLIVAANPVLSDLLRWAPGGVPTVRMMLWATAASVGWAAMMAPMRAGVVDAGRTMPGFGLTADIVAGALMAFNIIFAVGTALDLRYLWFGTALPDGMTYATYAHRGAYPLVVAAGLAGMFAILSRPFLTARSDIGPLLTLWMAQTVALVLSSVFRLALYVDAYGLTLLRVRAAVWMALVLMGLILIVVQIAKGHDVRWLLRRITLVAGVTLYACMFVNASALVAHVNISRADTRPADLYLLHLLGRDAAVPVARAIARGDLDSMQSFAVPQIDGWRDWSFRSARIRRSLAAMEDTP